MILCKLSQNALPLHPFVQNKKQEKKMSKIEIDDLEDNEDCECDLGCEENEDYFDDDEPKKKSKKATGKTLDDYLAALRKLFDHVEYEVLPYETQPNMIIDIKGLSRSYCRILCQKETGFINNKNSNIKHVNWLELQIRNENDWPVKHVKYIIDNYQLLKDENISFFAKDNPLDSIDMRKGLNYYLLYKSRKHDQIPSFNEMMKLRKTTLQHIFQNGLYEENNPRIDSFD